MNETSNNLLRQIHQQQHQSVSSATDAISAIVASQGNIELAAERLNMSQAALLTLISQDTQSTQILPLYIRTVASLYIFEALSQVRLALAQSIPDLQPYEVVKAFTSLIQLLKELTSTTEASTINVQELVLKMMPVQAREALLLLQSNNSN